VQENARQRKKLAARPRDELNKTMARALAHKPNQQRSLGAAKAKPTNRTGRRAAATSIREARVKAELDRSARIGGSEDTASGPPPHFVEPMKALAVEAVPAGDWLLEIKFDGYRALAMLGRRERQLWSRNGNSLSENYPEIVEALAKLKTVDTILDGEIVALDEEGRPRFQLLQGLAADPAGRPPIYYYVFDILRVNGKSVMQLPLEERKKKLAVVLKNAPAILKISPVFEEEPAVLLEHARRQGFEGIVAKAKGSLYEAGRRSGAWIKCRLAYDQEFVIAGYTPPNGARPYFGAILVGYYEGDRLLYAGKVGTGFDQNLLRSLYKQFETLKSPTCPFSNLPQPRKPRFGQGMTARAMREVVWLKPKLVGQIRFSEWTRDGALRQPVFLGLRDDKPAKEVVRELSATDSADK